MGHAISLGFAPAARRSGGLAGATYGQCLRALRRTVVKRLGDRVKHWFTVNEIPCFIGNGYGNGYFAPVGKSVLES